MEAFHACHKPKSVNWSRQFEALHACHTLKEIILKPLISAEPKTAVA